MFHRFRPFHVPRSGHTRTPAVGERLTKGGQAPTPAASEYATLTSTRDSAELIKVVDFKTLRVPWVTQGALI